MGRAAVVWCLGSVLLSWTRMATAGQEQPGLVEDEGAHSRFSCHGRVGGYYADIQSGCQLYHLCDGSGRQFTHMCPNQTLFQQRMMVCDHWYMVNCSLAELDFAANLLLGRRDQPFMGPADHAHHQHHPPGARANFDVDQRDYVYRQSSKSYTRPLSGTTLESNENNSGTISFSISSLPGARPPERSGALSNEKLESDYKNSRRRNLNPSGRVPVKSAFQRRYNFEETSSTTHTTEPAEVKAEPETERTVNTATRPLKRYQNGSGTQRFQYTEPDYGSKRNSSQKYSGRVITMPVFQKEDLSYTDTPVTRRSQQIGVLHVSSIPSKSKSDTGSGEDSKYNNRFDSEILSGHAPILPVFQKNTNFDVYKEAPTTESEVQRQTVSAASLLDRSGTRRGSQNVGNDSGRRRPVQAPVSTTPVFQRRIETSTLRPNTHATLQTQTEKTFVSEKPYINNSRQFISTDSSTNLSGEYRNNPFLQSYFRSSATVPSTKFPGTTTRPPVYDIQVEEDFGNHVELYLPDPRRMFFIPDNEADLIGGLESDFSKVLVIPLPSSEHRHGHMRFRSDEKEVDGQNPECPRCHPAFLLPGSCQPCVRIR